jgi:chloride channel 7
MMLIGALIGRIFGLALHNIFSSLSPPLDPSIYALVGSAALMSGFSRITISLVVIVVELTESTQFLLPIMLAVMCAKWVGDFFNKALYDELVELKSITFLDPKPPRHATTKSVDQVMQPDVVCIQEVEDLQTILQVLSSTTHNGFPVYKMSAENRRTYSGMILRKTLLILIAEKKYYHKDTQSPALLDWQHYISLTNRKWAIDQLILPSRDLQREFVIDVRPYMDKSHPVVVDTWCFADAYKMFCTLGLRHLPVVDNNFQIVGILTRHDLMVFYDPEYEDKTSWDNRRRV